MVNLVRSHPGESDEELSARLGRALHESGSLDFVRDGDMVALKSHFGEEGGDGWVRPQYLRMLGERVRSRGGRPFLTETSTLYKGRRSDALAHFELAQEHGFGWEATGLPLVMADGLQGDDERQLPVPGGQLYQRVNIAALFARIQGLLLVSHFTGHLATGFGAALKNLGMGCASRRGKLAQHSTSKPSVKRKKCTACGTCLAWCPQNAIRMDGEAARIDTARCIGCGECLAVCRFDAIGYNWSETYEQLQRKIVEHAWALCHLLADRLLAVTFLTRITRDCDCMGRHEPIAADIGVLFGRDAVAIDAAAVDLLQAATGKPLAGLTFDIPWKAQFDHARAIGFGDGAYELREWAP